MWVCVLSSLTPLIPLGILSTSFLLKKRERKRDVHFGLSALSHPFDFKGINICKISCKRDIQCLHHCLFSSSHIISFCIHYIIYINTQIRNRQRLCNFLKHIFSNMHKKMHLFFKISVFISFSSKKKSKIVDKIKISRFCFQRIYFYFY